MRIGISALHAKICAPHPPEWPMQFGVFKMPIFWIWDWRLSVGQLEPDTPDLDSCKLNFQISSTHTGFDHNPNRF